MDLGRHPEARYHGSEVLLERSARSPARISATSCERIGHFGEDNRAGIERTLHRISCIRNRAGDVIGLTCRIGRAVYGTINIIRDLVEIGQEHPAARAAGRGQDDPAARGGARAGDEFGKRVVIVDTSNEIAGDGDIPHPSIGRARRMQVPSPARQHAVMIEAVENHMPEVIVIDEIGTELEAPAARTIAERGVQLVGTAHGNTLENLMLNPTLSDLIGGIQTVTLGDEEARRRGTQKSVLERKAPPTFDVMVEILDRDRVAVHQRRGRDGRLDPARASRSRPRSASGTPTAASVAAQGQFDAQPRYGSGLYAGAGSGRLRAAMTGRGRGRRAVRAGAAAGRGVRAADRRTAARAGGQAAAWPSIGRRARAHAPTARAPARPPDYYVRRAARGRRRRRPSTRSTTMGRRRGRRERRGRSAAPRAPPRPAARPARPAARPSRCASTRSG